MTVSQLGITASDPKGTAAAVASSDDPETGNENPRDAEASGTSTPVEEVTATKGYSDSLGRKSSSTHRRKFGTFMRRNSAKSLDVDIEKPSPGSEKGRKNFFSHMRTLSMGQYHSIQREDALAAAATSAKSDPYLVRPPSGELRGSVDSSSFGASVTEVTGTLPVTEINVTDVDGDTEVFGDEVRIIIYFLSFNWR